jgi:hypothetical protein
MPLETLSDRFSTRNLQTAKAALAQQSDARSAVPPSVAVWRSVRQGRDTKTAAFGAQETGVRSTVKADLVRSIGAGWTETTYGGSGTMPPVVGISIAGAGHMLPCRTPRPARR